MRIQGAIRLPVKITQTSYNFVEKILNNVVLCIRTLGCAADAAISSIAAVLFDDNQVVTNPFSCAVDIDSCLSAGLSVDQRGLLHWATQPSEINRTNSKLLVYALDDLRRGFDWEDAIVWVDQADLVGAVLDTAYRRVGHDIPWSFYNVRDISTLIGAHAAAASPEASLSEVAMCVAESLQLHLYGEPARNVRQA